MVNFERTGIWTKSGQGRGIAQDGRGCGDASGSVWDRTGLVRGPGNIDDGFVGVCVIAAKFPFFEGVKCGVVMVVKQDGRRASVRTERPRPAVRGQPPGDRGRGGDVSAQLQGDGFIGLGPLAALEDFRRRVAPDGVL